MKVIIYINILKDADFNFNDPALNMANSFKEENVLVFDIDNYSSAEILRMATELVSKSSDVCFLIKSGDPEGTFPFSGILEPLFSNDKNLFFVIEGKNAFIEKILTPFKKDVRLTESLLDEERHIKTFLSDQE